MKGVGRRQFMLAKSNAFDLNWPTTEVGEYTLCYHSDIEYACVESGDKIIHLVGELFDWENPNWSNEDILNYLVNETSRSAFLETLSRFMGHYMLVFQSDEHFFLLNDACGQYEVYYSSDFSVVGSQVKLMSQVLSCQPHEDPEAISFFDSPSFLSKKIFVGHYTHVANVRHLRPNHLIDFKNEKVERFFPMAECSKRTLVEAASLGVQMINGYVASIAARHKIFVAVTAGYDSRVLFFTSLTHQAHYYISQHVGMPHSHIDIETGRQLSDLMNVEFRVIKDLPQPPDWLETDFGESIDFPRYVNQLSFDLEKCIYLNGNCGEVVRNYFGSFPFLTGKDLAKMLGYPNTTLATRVCRNWLSENKELLKSMNYNVLDLFYWEEKMGNWGAKKRTETNAIGRVVYSPFNSRALFEVLLGTKRKYRDSHQSIIYDEILKRMHPESLIYPINPSKKNRAIILLKKIGVYNYYRFVGFKLGIIKA